MKKVFIDGRLGKDAELKQSKNGNNYLHFTLANNTYVNKEEKTEWYDVYSTDDFIISYKTNILKKGTYVIVSGTEEVEINTNNGKLYMNFKVRATDVEIPSFKKKDDTEAVNTNGVSTGMPTQSQAPTTVPTPNSINTMPSTGIPVQQPQTYQPTPQPTPQPVYQPSPQPTAQPTYQPTPQPVYQPAPQPTYPVDDLPF